MRRMSFSMTTDQFLDGTKDVTRRLGWKFLMRKRDDEPRPRDYVMGIEKGMGLKKGQKQHELGPFRVLEAWREPLNVIDADEVRREGFPGMSPPEFIDMFIRANRCAWDNWVTRIGFKRIVQSPDAELRHGYALALLQDFLDEAEAVGFEMESDNLVRDVADFIAAGDVPESYGEIPF